MTWTAAAFLGLGVVSHGIRACVCGTQFSGALFEQSQCYFAFEPRHSSSTLSSARQRGHVGPGRPAEGGGSGARAVAQPVHLPARHLAPAVQPISYQWELLCFRTRATERMAVPQNAFLCECVIVVCF